MKGRYPFFIQSIIQLMKSDSTNTCWILRSWRSVSVPGKHDRGSLGHCTVLMELTIPSRPGFLPWGHEGLGWVTLCCGGCSVHGRRFGLYIPTISSNSTSCDRKNYLQLPNVPCRTTDLDTILHSKLQ